MLNEQLIEQLNVRRSLDWAITVGSAFACLLALPTRIPGMELLGVGPNWLLIWVVAWSVRRTALQGAIAGFTLGLIQDGMTAAPPTHALSLAIVGIITARLRKQRYIQEDFISIALIVFGMVVVAETIMAIQFSVETERNLVEIWTSHQRIAISSAILSSLWAPALYYPLKRWWSHIAAFEELQT